VVMLIFVFLSIEPPTVLFFASFLYMLSGPVVSLFRWNRNRQRLSGSAEDDEPEEDK
jgi:hypothetical protein